MDTVSSKKRMQIMRSVRNKGTNLERIIWAMLAGMGINNWKKNDPSIIGTPDISFIEIKKAIFINGCFWHGCKTCNRKTPESNNQFWEEKIQKNIVRDKKTYKKLGTENWEILIIWEHDLKNKKLYRNVRESLYRFIDK
jgi:DNA mismatch endonuclease (patch repair protein)